jgi:alkylation response protein AidB-like acyl-CoA dehydrogenase
MPSHSETRPGDARFEQLLAELVEATPLLEADDAWPGPQFERLAGTGVLRWTVPRDFGGAELTQAELIAGYEQLAAACLTTTFVLTQRDGACHRIAGSENEELQRELLPSLAVGKLFATVGISHLTTSRQHLKQPAVRVTPTGDGFVLNGTVPWVTGAAHADFVVTGGACDDGRQVLIAVPTVLPGVTVQEPVRLLALTASQTASVELRDARVPAKYLLAGPVVDVMKRGVGGGAGSVATSALAVGLTRRAVEHLEREAARRDDLRESVVPLRRELEEVRRDLLAAARGDAGAPVPGLSVPAIRQRSNSLVLRATQAQLAASKGAGFVRGHPAERAVREAMFFLVWSCPQPVLAAALREFACLADA